jgi:hypothetical protein
MLANIQASWWLSMQTTTDTHTIKKKALIARRQIRGRQCASKQSMASWSFRSQWQAIKRQQPWSEKCENGFIAVDIVAEGSSMPTGRHCQWSYPKEHPPAECHWNCWLNKCRLIHYHHCHCCVRCRRCQNHHCRLSFVGMQRNIECSIWWSIPARHFVLWCYRLITTMWFKWCHCHCYWRCGKLSFAMVHLFGVADVGCKEKMKETTRRVFSPPHFSTGLWYKLYRSWHLALS